MSEPQLLRVCSIRELSSRRGTRVWLDDDTELALFRIDGVVYAVSNICPHQHAPAIADGFIEDCTVACPLHGWTYDLRTGNPVVGGARLKTYKVVVDGDDVFVEQPPPERPRWMLW
ncbi:MAG: Rieske (2Fe-2S) protein [Armatimonadetes bacterium]|nr:Rieske (2Fe-2S) protein [Armatimonadota bacterium]